MVLKYIELSDKTRDKILSLTEHPDQEVRALAIEMLGVFCQKRQEAINVLLLKIQTEKEHNKSVAIEALAKICDDPKIVVPILIDALDDDDYSFCEYEGCVDSAADYLLEYVNRAKTMELFEKALPILLNDIKEMEEISNVDDNLKRVQLLGKFGPRAKSALPKLKKYLKGFLKYDPEAKEKHTAILKQAVEAIEKE